MISGEELAANWKGVMEQELGERHSELKLSCVEWEVPVGTQGAFKIRS